MSLVPGQQKELNKAKRMREELQALVSATIEEFGPKMHEDFDKVRGPVFVRMPSLTELTSGESFHPLLFLPPPTSKVYGDTRRASTLMALSSCNP